MRRPQRALASTESREGCGHGVRSNHCTLQYVYAAACRGRARVHEHRDVACARKQTRKQKKQQTNKNNYLLTIRGHGRRLWRRSLLLERHARARTGQTPTCVVDPLRPMGHEIWTLFGLGYVYSIVGTLHVRGMNAVTPIIECGIARRNAWKLPIHDVECLDHGMRDTRLQGNLRLHGLTWTNLPLYAFQSTRAVEPACRIEFCCL